MQTRKSLEDKASKFQMIAQSWRLSMRNVYFTLTACRNVFLKGLEHGYFLGLKDAEEIMASRKLPWKTGAPTGKRILAGIQWSDEEMHFDVLYHYPCMGLKYPAGYYDVSGECVPNSAIKQFVEF